MSSLPHIDFAVNAPDRLHLICRIVRKHYQSGKRIAVYSRNDPFLAEFDKALWTFSALSFIPHVAANDPLADRSPVVFSSDFNALPSTEILVNLDDEIPPQMTRYLQVIEVVGNDEQGRQSGRARFKCYRDLGHDIQVHDMAAHA